MNTLKRRTPEWLKSAIFYQIYPQSFSDSNDDGIGDLQGVIDRLDYLQWLGVNALWLNPIFDSPFQDAGYDVRDFYRVAPRYGSNADLKRLCQQAHRRGMRVCLDLVAGHTSIEHPWFRASSDGRQGPHRDWFIWTDSVWNADAGGRLAHGDFIKGYGSRDGNFLTNFFWFQPALNYGFAKPDPSRRWQQSPRASGPRAVREELKKIMAFWLDLGCDGFRVDMASSLVKLDTDGRAMRALWSEFRRWLERRNPEAVLIAEWSRPSDAIAAGFHVDFLIHFNEPAYNELIGPTRTLVRGGRTPSVFFQRQGGGDIRPFLDNYLEQYEATKHLGFIALPTGNHDFPRPRHGRSEAELRVLYTMLLLMPGVPFIYYGDEIGMRYLEGLPSKEGSYEKRTGTRTPMQWNRGKNRGFSKAPSGALYLPVDAAADAPTVDAQQRSPTSLLNFTKRLLALRQTSAALQNAGGFRPVVTEPTKPFVFERFSKTERYLVAINPSSRAATTPLPETSHRWVSVVDEGVAVKDGVLRARPVSAGVFRRA